MPERIAVPDPAFDVARFQSQLSARHIGRFFVYRESVGSTMEVARLEADQGAAHGTLVFAEEQTAGRGRRGRSFHSPAGENLYFTLVLRCPIEVHRRLPVIVPAAVCAAIREFVPEAAIKWPNDIWVGERKTCGMLIDAEIAPAGALAFPGIGINVNGDPTLQPELRDIATSLSRETGAPVDRERLLAGICNELEALLEADEHRVASSYREMSCILGRQVTVHPHGADAFEGIATEIAETGDLGVLRADGSIEWVTAADVTLRPKSTA